MFNFIKSLFGSSSSKGLATVMERKPFLVDVRTADEYAQGHPKGSVNIPLDKLLLQIDKFKGKNDIVVFCRSGNRSSQAHSILTSKGIANVTNGGTWQNVAQYTG